MNKKNKNFLKKIISAEDDPSSKQVDSNKKIKKLATIVEGDPKVPFSIVTRWSEGR